jgi:hypothetical protein
MIAFHLATAASMLFGAAAVAPGASAQNRPIGKQLAGTWTLVSVSVDGLSKQEPYGPKPAGIMMFDGAGNFSVTIVRNGVPKFASDNRMQGTESENKAAVQGSLAYFGTYEVDEATHALTVHIADSTYPNFRGQTQKRVVTLSGNELTVTNPTPSGGGGMATQVWRRY